MRALAGVAAVLLFAGAAHSAADPYEQVWKAPRDQAVAMVAQTILAGIENGTLGERDNKILPELKKLIDDMAETKHLHYGMDHRRLDDLVREMEGKVYDYYAGASESAGRVTYPGYRPAPNGNYAALYRSRVNNWEEYMRKVTEGNGKAAEDVRKAASEVKKLNDASDEAYGYLQLIQADARINNFVNEELVKLQADLGRRLDLKVSIEMNDAQERADELSAFEAAVASWKNSGAGREY